MMRIADGVVHAVTGAVGVALAPPNFGTDSRQ
jgi:hypothetical protein